MMPFLKKAKAQEYMLQETGNFLAQMDSADAVIFAVDLEVKDRNRFNGKPYIQVPVAKAMKDAVGLVEQVLAMAADGTAPKVGDGASAKPAETKAPSSEPSQKKGGFFGSLFGKK